MDLEGAGFVIGLIGAIWMKKLDESNARIQGTSPCLK